MILPCSHRKEVTDQVQPTIALLSSLDEWHPDVLLQHQIQPADYKGGLVFRSAVESIRGSFIASSRTGREGMVGDILENLMQRGNIAGYEHSGSSRRYDFTVVLSRDPESYAAVEVKGGEGNSINISERPLWASEVDVLIFKDPLCGTPTRPCPKYPGREDSIGLLAAPDIFLFPCRIPTIEDPQPPVHSVESLAFAAMVLTLFDVAAVDYCKHLWEVHTKVVKLDDGRLRREVGVQHQGQMIERTKGRPWRP